MKRSTVHKWLCGVAMLMATSAISSSALADVAIGFDLDYAVPIKLDSVSPGWGVGARVGSQIHVPMLVITPELGFTYHQFGGDAAPKVYRGIGGLRLGIGEVIRPGVFGHVGYGARKIDLAGGSDTAWSFTYDFGAFLDFTALPVLNIGVHAAYNQWTGAGQPSFQFGTLGAHAALIF